LSPKPRNILVLFAHPALQKSRVNRRLVRGLEQIDRLTLHDLYEEYPRFDIDVRQEQELLSESDVIVLQHPFYWYSTPALLKEYQDLVLEHGWAYGREGTALRGKILLNAVSTGGSAEAYCSEGRNRFTVRQLLAPIEQTAFLCGMRFLAPFVIHGTHALDVDGIEAHRHDYHRVLRALRDDEVDLGRASSAVRLNADLDSLLRQPAS
jgi:glutathione-regulated potassium-efflux system ancillary protein KefG